jgi:hypothetical protein
VPHVPRAHASGLPPAPSISPAAIFRGGIFLLCVLLLLLIVWVAKSLFSSAAAPSTERVPPPPQAVAQPTEPTFNLIALGPVAVRVSSPSADGWHVIFESALARGQIQSVPWPGKVWIQANPGVNLNIEYNGHTISIPVDLKTHLQNDVVLPGPHEMK